VCGVGQRLLADLILMNHGTPPLRLKGCKIFKTCGLGWYFDFGDLLNAEYGGFCGLTDVQNIESVALNDKGPDG
jgi:hypothetical protein